MDAIARTETTAFDWGCRTTAVALVDLAVIGGFVTIGVVNHGTNPLVEPLAALETVLPFVLGWAIIAPLSGVYGAARSEPGPASRRTAVGWIAAANVGLLLRTSPLFDGGATWPFGLVITATGLVCLVAWRLAYATVFAGEAPPSST